MANTTTSRLEANYPGLSGATLCEAFQTTAHARSSSVALRTRGDAVVVTWAEYAERVEALAAGLAGLGVRPGDTVGTMLTNRPEFHFVDAAATHLGAIPFGIYNTSPPDEIRHRLANARPRIVITERALLGTLQAGLKISEGVEHVVVVDDDVSGTLTLRDVEAAGPADFDFEASWRAVAAEDIVTLIYTSGTTGPPKGVQWSHGSVMAVLRSWSQVQPLPGRCVSYLPFAHAAERMFSQYMPQASGGTVTCCEDPRSVLTDVAESHPDFLACVPRMWAKLKSAIRTDIAELADEDVRREIERTIVAGERRVELAHAGAMVPDDLVATHERGLPVLRSTVLPRYGLDQVKLSMNGGAPAQPDVQRFFLAAGLSLLDGYGSTESTSCISLPVDIDDFRMGTVGRPIPGLEVQLAEDGEILIRGETVMSGYRNQPDATAEAFTPDGFFRTGDIGEWDDGGRLRLIDRKKELIINDSGKNMSPATIQAAIKSESPLIAHCVAIGSNRPYNVGLLTLDRTELAVFAASRGLGIATLDAALQTPEVTDEVEQAVERGNAKLSRVEQLRKYLILPVEWVPDSDELTPTAKVKRRNVESKFADEISRLYS